MSHGDSRATPLRRLLQFFLGLILLLMAGDLSFSQDAVQEVGGVKRQVNGSKSAECTICCQCQSGPPFRRNLNPGRYGVYEE